MDHLRAIPIEGELRPWNLAAHPPFRIGNTLVTPSRRLLSAETECIIEPRVMEVLLTLHAASGETVSREELIDRCWAGRIVGDDAINRVIAGLRKAAKNAGADFTVETITRVGYRIDFPDAPIRPLRNGPSRRVLLAGAAAAAGLAAFSALQWRASRPTELVNGLARARVALRPDSPDENAHAVEILTRLANDFPGNAEVLGLLAVAWRNTAEYAESDTVSRALAAAERAARQALAIDPENGDAMAALATLQPFVGNWSRCEGDLLAVLDIAPDTLHALAHLTTLYQASGVLEQSKLLNDRALAIDPLSPIFQFRAALKHWIYGDRERADLEIGRALQVWPRHTGTWNARMMIYAYSDRTDEAREFLADERFGPVQRSPPLIANWHATLDLLDDPTRTAERAAILQGARMSSPFAVLALMTLSKARLLDDAFDLARAYFLGRGDMVSTQFASPETVMIVDQAWRRSMMLFTPATRAMREDARFDGLARDMGLVEFWGTGRHPPDFRDNDLRLAITGS